MMEEYDDDIDDDEEYERGVGAFVLWHGVRGTVFTDREDVEEAYDILTEGLTFKQAKKKEIYIDVIGKHEFSNIIWARATSPVQ